MYLKGFFFSYILDNERTYSQRHRTPQIGSRGEWAITLMQAGNPRLIIAPRVTLIRFTLRCPATAGRAQNPRFHARPIWAANLCCYAEGKSGADRQAWNHVVRCTAASPAAAAVCHTEIVRLPAQRCDARHLFLSSLHKWWNFCSPEPFNDHNYRTDARGEKSLMTSLEQSHDWARALKSVLENHWVSGTFTAAQRTAANCWHACTAAFIPQEGWRLHCCQVAKAITVFVVFFFLTFHPVSPQWCNTEWCRLCCRQGVGSAGWFLSQH